MDRWLFVNNAPVGGINPYAAIMNWVPRFGDRECVRVHRIDCTHILYPSATVTRYGYYAVLDRPLGNAADVPDYDLTFTGGKRALDEFRGSIKVFQPWQETHPSATYYNNVIEWHKPWEFPLTFDCLGLCLMMRTHNYSTQDHVYVKIHYERVVLPTDKWDYLLQRNSWLLNGRQPTSTEVLQTANET